MPKSLFFLFFVLQFNVHAEEWSQTNVQFLYGNDFKEVAGGDSVIDRKMKTITIEHAGSWEYGSNFFFVDMTSANFSSGKRHKIYGEWAPKISLSKVSGTELSWSFIKDILIAGEINQGDNFRANNLGLGLSLDLATFDFFDFNLFHRKDNFNDATFQLTLAWLNRFDTFSLPMRFEGFFDYYGTNFGTEIVTQPRLLLDGKYFGDATKSLQVGVEFYYYKSSATPWRDSIDELVPQLMLKWTW